MHPVNYSIAAVNPVYMKTQRHRVSELEKWITAASDRRLVYFIGTRRRIRLFRPSLPGRPIGVAISKSGRRPSRKRRLRLEELDRVVRRSEREAYVSVAENVLSVWSEGVVTNVHGPDLVDRLGLDLGNSLRISYVGETDSPIERPLNGNHAGLNRVLASPTSEGCDVFVYYGIFHVTIRNRNPGEINFHASNSLVDLIKKREESRFIQNAFIKHFIDPLSQPNYSQEMAQLRNSVKSFATLYNVREMNFYLEVDAESDTYRFESDTIEPTRRIAFSLRDSDFS